MTNVPFVRDDEIEYQAEALLSSYAKSAGLSRIEAPIPIDEIIQEHLQIRFEIDDLPAILTEIQIRLGTAEPLAVDDVKTVLGATFMDGDGQIIVDEKLEHDAAGRMEFTMAHEVGHWILHRPIYIAKRQQADLFSTPERGATVVCRDVGDFVGTKKPRGEIQADRFAGALLAPEDLVTKAFDDIHGKAPIVLGTVAHPVLWSDMIGQAFDAGSTRIHAVRIGTPERASIILKDTNGDDTLRLRGDHGSSANNHFVNVWQTIERCFIGYAALYDGDDRYVVLYEDGDLEEGRYIGLPEEIGEAVGVEVDVLPQNLTGARGFWVLGRSTDPEPMPMLWRLDETGAISEGDTIDLTSHIPEGDTITGLAGPTLHEDEVIVCTDHHLLWFMRDEEGGDWEFDGSWSFEDAGLPSPDVSSVTYGMDIKTAMIGDMEAGAVMLILDRTASRIYGFSEQFDDPAVALGSVDIGMWVGGDTPEGVTMDGENGEVYVAVRNDGSYPYSRVLRFEIDWEAPSPSVDYLGSLNIDPDVRGLGSFVTNAEVTTRVTMQDRNESPVLTRVYEGSGTFETVTQDLVDEINEDGVYEAVVLVDEPPPLMPSMQPGEYEMPDPAYYESMSGGVDADDPTNADYLNGLAATVDRTDTAWIHAVGANTPALWTAILLHCAEMFEQHQAERFAILETPEFDSDEDDGSAEYLGDLQDYVDEVVDMAAAVGDRNAVIFAGGADFMDSDGEVDDAPITAAAGGTMAGLEVQKSLINKPVRNVLGLWPEFSQGHIQSLIQARVNCIRFKPGRGFIIAHSLTAAATGSDYNRVNDLRAVYYGSKAAREAAQVYVGEENDKAGEGLRRLESAMSRPLEVMRDGGQIDDFELTAVSTATDRLLGDVYVSLGIQPRRAMEMIYTTVYLK
jgi:hypothetical protein